jgi:hypothetical protein
MQPGDPYTAQDVDQFSALVSQCQQQSPTFIDRDENKQNEALRHFDYSPNDDDAFEKLMDMDSRGHDDDNEETKKVQHFTKEKTRDGYTNTDHENFSALMSFDECSVGHIVGNRELENRTSTDKRDFSYTDQDQLNFERLIPTNDQGDVNHGNFISEAQDNPSSTTDRDVGVIKIVEFNKPKSNKSRTKDRPNENIKIRFFD